MAQSFDTPITTNDQSIERVVSSGMPIALVFLDGSAQTILQQTMQRLARENAGQMLIVKIQARENPLARSRYEITRTPALVTLKDGKVLAQAAGISASDLEKHTAYLLGKGPQPEPEAEPAKPAETQHRTQSGTNGGPKAGPKHPVEVTDATFQKEVMESGMPVLVDFWAPWCGPCRMTEPILEKLAVELTGRLKIAKINVDNNPRVAQQHDIRSIPTMMLVKDGKIASRWVGALPEPALRGKIAPYI